MNTKIRLFITIILIITVKYRVFSNDGNVISWNGNIRPGKSSKVSMVKEAIYISLSDDIGSVRCKFWFYNHGSNDTLLVGFPGENFNSDAPGFNPVEDFKSTIDNKPVEVRESYEEVAIDTIINDDDGTIYLDTSNYRKWYVKEAVFKANDTTIIEDSYYAGWQGSSGANFTDKIFEYIIGTGSTWYGPIGEATIIFDYSNYATSALMPAYSKDSTFDIDNHTGINYSVTHLTNCTPKDDQVVSIQFFDVDKIWFDDLDIENPSDEFTATYKNFINRYNLKWEDLVLIKNEILAKNGYVFKDSVIRKYYSSMKWYKPDANFSLRGFSQPVYDILKREVRIKPKMENLIYRRKQLELDREKDLQIKCLNIDKIFNIEQP